MNDVIAKTLRCASLKHGGIFAGLVETLFHIRKVGGID
jgi:hypothetical protein